MSTTLLTEERRQQIRAALQGWYEQFPRGERVKNLEEHGFNKGPFLHWVDGTRTPPPREMKRFFELTTAHAFRLTAEEKERYRRYGKEVPDQENWPDLEVEYPKVVAPNERTAPKIPFLDSQPTSPREFYSTERRKQMSAAFFEWYDQQHHKAEACELIGFEGCGGVPGFYRKESSPPPPKVLCAMWKETANPVFCLTAEEKERIRRLRGDRANLPDVAEWPDLTIMPPNGEEVSTTHPQPESNTVSDAKVVEEVPETMQPEQKPVASEPAEDQTVDDLIKDLYRMAKTIHQLSELAPDDPRRIEARAKLAQPAMELYARAKMLSFKTPDKWRDYEEQMDRARFVGK